MLAIVGHGSRSGWRTKMIGCGEAMEQSNSRDTASASAQQPILTPAQSSEMRVRAAQRAHDDEKDFGAVANAAAVKNAEEAIKTAILVNGGSSVAMLAFIGTLVSQGVVTRDQLGEITSPLIYFGSGVAAAVIASAASYFTNLGIAHRSNRRTREFEAPFIRDNKSSVAGGRWAELARWVGILAVAASIGLFIGGLISAKSAFTKLTPIVKPQAMTGLVEHRGATASPNLQSNALDPEQLDSIKQRALHLGTC